MNAIILAGGMGKRMEKDYPKQFIELKGKPLLIYTLEAIGKHKNINKIILTYPKNYMEQYENMIVSYGINKVTLVEGGETRQQSVFKALKLVESRDVLIHEAARPFLSLDFIDEIISNISHDIDGVVPVIKIPFTVAIGNDFMESELNRDNLRNIQLPQVFKTDILLNSHLKAIEENYETTEDGTLVFHYGGKIKFIEGRESNIKVTTPLDIHILNKFFNI